MYLFRYKHAPISAPKYACLCMISKTTFDVYTTFNLRNLFQQMRLVKSACTTFKFPKLDLF